VIFTGESPVVEALTESATASPTLTLTHAWTLAKTATAGAINIAAGTGVVNYTLTTTEGAGIASAWRIAGSVTVANPNATAAVADITVSYGATTCAVTNGTDVTVPAAAGGTPGSVQRDYVCTFTTAPSLTDTLTAGATWTANGTERTDEGERTLASADWVTTSVHATVDVADEDSAGNTHDFTYPATAPGTEHLQTYSTTYTLTAAQCLTVTNDAEVRGDANALLDTADATATLCLPSVMTGTDPGTGTLTRTYGWSIAKQMTNSANFAAAVKAGTYNLAYRVTVTDQAAVNSAITAGGTVRIENQNPWDLRADLSSSLDIAGVTCTLDQTEDVLIPANLFTEVDYTCAGDPGDVVSGTHTVHVTPSDGVAFTAFDITGSLTYTVTEVNKTITITDDQITFNPAWQVTWTAPGAERSTTYSIPVQVVAERCQILDNTARISQTAQQATTTTRICGAVETSDQSGETPTNGTSAPPATGAARLAATGPIDLALLVQMSILALSVGAGLVWLSVRRRRA
jgi:hypothetical protein